MPLYSIDGVSPQLPPEGEYFIAPNAVLIGRVRLAKNASVWFGAVLRGDNDWITLGEGCNVQDNAVLHTDSGQPIELGAGVTVGHNATIHSARVGDYALIGMGATLLNGAVIGASSVVGANALIPEGRVYSDGSLIVGAPGRVIRSLDEAQRERLFHASQVYIEKSVRYRNTLVRVA